jgi:hypothetical protein
MSIKCNHLVPRHDQDKKCFPHSIDSKTHFWLPTGNIEAKFNNSIQVDFYCKYCNSRTTNFFTKEEYELNKKVLGV